MKLEDIKQVAVLGAGIMGHGIAQGFIMGGYPTKIFDINQDALDVAVAHIKESLGFFMESGLLTREQADQAISLTSTTTDLEEAVKDAQFITEVIPEILELKQDTFAKMESMAPEGAIFASNTSHLPLSRLFDKCKDRSRVVGTHYFNPPQIVPCVEIIKAEGTSDETFNLAYDIIDKIGKAAVRCKKDVPGFIVNRVQTAVLREVCDLVANGVADPEDIDKAIKASMGFRTASIGPLKMVDLGGVDAWEDCCAHLLPEMNADRTAPQAMIDLVAKGEVGIRSGKGFYSYGSDFMQETLDEEVQQRDREFVHRLKNLYWNK